MLWHCFLKQICTAVEVFFSSRVQPRTSCPDRSVSSSIRLSALVGLVDFPWAGGMRESRAALVEQNRLCLARLRKL